jgi:hypothetical protein
VGLGAEGSADALANQPHTRPMDFTGKTMRIFVFVTAPGVRTDGPWSSWLGSSRFTTHAQPKDQ